MSKSGGGTCPESNTTWRLSLSGLRTRIRFLPDPPGLTNAVFHLGGFALGFGMTGAKDYFEILAGTLFRQLTPDSVNYPTAGLAANEKA